MSIAAMRLRSVPVLRTVLALLAFASGSLYGCSESVESGSGGAEADADGSGDRTASCERPRRYFVALREGTCSSIDGLGGTWMPSALFADAPADVQTATCTFDWISDGAYPDEAALVSGVPHADVFAPACGDASRPAAGELEQVAYAVDPGVGSSPGCDVCGRFSGERMWLVLPPDLTFRTFAVRLSNGEERAFRIRPSSSRALSVILPPAPAGTTYRSGAVPIY